MAFMKIGRGDGGMAGYLLISKKNQNFTLKFVCGCFGGSRLDESGFELTKTELGQV